MEAAFAVCTPTVNERARPTVNAANRFIIRGDSFACSVDPRRFFVSKNGSEPELARFGPNATSSSRVVAPIADLSLLFVRRPRDGGRTAPENTRGGSLE